MSASGSESPQDIEIPKPELPDWEDLLPGWLVAFISGLGAIISVDNAKAVGEMLGEFLTDPVGFITEILSEALVGVIFWFYGILLAQFEWVINVLADAWYSALVEPIRTIWNQAVFQPLNVGIRAYADLTESVAEPVGPLAPVVFVVMYGVLAIGVIWAVRAVLSFISSYIGIDIEGVLGSAADTISNGARRVLGTVRRGVTLPFRVIAGGDRDA